VRYLPIFLDVRGQPCLLVGGGAVALRKARTLLSAGAQLVVVAPEVEPVLRSQLAESGGLLRERAFEPADLSGVRLVIAATDDAELNARIWSQAQAAGIPVNVVDDPAHCSFVMPAIVDRSPVLLAVSSSGASPVLARKLRARLETLIAPGYGRLAELAGRYRVRVQAELPAEARRAFWEAVLEGPVAERVFAGDEAGAEALLAEQLAAGGAVLLGEVLLVHAGPGEPDLLTLRGLRQLQRASHVLHAPGAPEAVLALARRDALVEAVAEPGQLDVALALAGGGARVCVLRTGSGFAEAERQRLRDSGLAWLEVPGLPGARSGG
jgi:uroporphyrin-III C-methyltransferase/precorrin-2 dehydrogenase/sirohydrochlorin ferrochelatase